MLDARKGEVYAGFYRVAGDGVTSVRPEEALAPEALASRLEGLGVAVGFGEGYAAHAGALASVIPLLDGAPATPSGPAVGRLAAPRLVAASFDDQALFALEPHYVRKSEAEVKFPNGIP
jgi:tRNA threonylcarbamoyladenosine biosynthesis protein TsaB